MELQDTLRELVAALTSIRPGSDNEANAVAFLYDNAVRFHRFPSVDAGEATAELRGLATKLLTHGRTAGARRLTELVHALHDSAGGAAAARTARLLLDLAGNPLRVDVAAHPLTPRPPLRRQRRRRRRSPTGRTSALTATTATVRAAAATPTA
jgi:hypothetical protein